MALQPPIAPCDPCSFSATLGLPCRQMIFRKLQDKEPIQLEEVDRFWHLENPTGLRDLDHLCVPSELLVISGKGRPKGALGLEENNQAKSTCRDPSLFERVVVQEATGGVSNRQQQQQPSPSTAPALMTKTSTLNSTEGRTTIR